jgi:hypothetical protein
MLFPDALKLNTNYYAYQVLSDMAPPMFQNGQVLKTPNFTFGGRVEQLAAELAVLRVPQQELDL